ncbi:MAG: GAF domain-containing protein, partial [Spirochaetaceae bacterium]
NNPDLRYFLLIGAHRDVDADMLPPCAKFLKDLGEHATGVQRIALSLLAEKDVRLFMEDTFGTGTAGVHDLSGIIHARTGGNPFFIRQFIKNLYHENFIAFLGTWQIDIERIKRTQMTDNLVSFMLERIHKFDNDLQEILRTAACIGIRINLELLSQYFSTPREILSGCFMEVMREGMVIMHDGVLHFAHDRIQESLYSVIDEVQKADIHYHLGKLMHDSYPASGYSVFDIADQLYLGRNFFTDTGDYILAASVNHAAGMKARGEAAFSSAHVYFRHAFSILPTNSWKTDYHLSLSIASELCEAGFLTGDITETERYYNIVMANARNFLDTDRVHQVIIGHYTQIQKVREGMEIGLKFLNSLGYGLPKIPHPLIILRELMTARIRLAGKKPRDIRTLPVMNDPVAQSVVRILLDMGEASFVGYPEFFPLITSRIVNISLSMGNSPASPYSYVTYGWMILSVMGDIEKGFSIAQTGLHLASQIGASHLAAKTYFIYGAFVHHWKFPFASVQEYLRKAIDSGTRYGDFSFASYALNHLLIFTYCSGENLKRVLELYKKYWPEMKKFQKQATIDAFRIWEDLVTLLSDRSTILNAKTHTLEIRAGYSSEAAVVQEWKTNHQMTNMGFYYTAKCLLNYHLGKYEEGLSDAHECQLYLGSMAGSVFIPEYYFYYALILTALSSSPAPSRRRKNLAQARACEKKLRRWAKSCPENYSHKHMLVVAELAAASHRKKKYSTVNNLYERAIILAHENGFLHEEALVYERYGTFALASGDAKRSADLLLSAYRLYKQWDSGAKLAYMEETFPTINFQGSYMQSLIQTESTLAKEVDTRTILKATHAISGEIFLGKLLPRLLEILIENTGAQRGFLLLQKEKHLLLTARYANGSAEFINETMDEAATNEGELPATVINYVKRTQEPLLVTDALSDPVFSADPYVKVHQVKSVLCMPLLRQGKLFGIILLENNILSGAFTNDRFEIVKLLSAQAIISIENSMLFQRSLSAEQQLQRQFEESRQQYTEMEKLHEELESTYTRLSETHAHLEQESELLSIFKKLADASGQGLFMSDLSFRITYSNAAFQEIVKSPGEDDLAGTEFRKFYNQDTTIRMDMEIIPAVKSRGQWTGELQIVSCTGDTVDVLQNMFLIRDNEGNPHHLASVITDLTDRKKIEDEQRKSSKIESLGVFAGGLAHDFNNYLTAITANLSFLKSTRDEHIDPVILDDVLEACDRAKNLTMQLLAFSKGGTPVRVTCQIRKMIAKTANFVLAGSGIKCITEIPEDLWEVFVDQSQISQVIHNIVLNARQVLDNTGIILIRAENMALPAENEPALPEGRYIRISIHDTGPGIPPELVDNIFDPYFTTKKTGSGLGLTVSYSIIKKHDGHLLVHSKRGEGAAFVIYLPASIEQESIRQAKKPSDMFRRYAGRVLVMDDDLSILAVA